jgi:hypothetical protein
MYFSPQGKLSPSLAEEVEKRAQRKGEATRKESYGEWQHVLKKDEDSLVDAATIVQLGRILEDKAERKGWQQVRKKAEVEVEKREQTSKFLISGHSKKYLIFPGTLQFLNAVQNEDFDAIQSYLEDSEEYADVSVKSRRGETALHLAAASSSDDVEILEYLLEQGAEKDVRNQDGNTPLHVAVLKQNYHAVRLLQLRGASSTIKNKKGQTAVDLAELPRCDTRITMTLKYPRPVEPVLLVPNTRNQKPPPKPNDAEEMVCQHQTAHLCYFSEANYLTFPMSVHELIYTTGLQDRGPKDGSGEFRSRANRWIHLPANNVSTQCACY